MTTSKSEVIDPHRLCGVCRHRSTPVFRQTVLSRYSVEYFRCENCGLVFTETPYWLEEAYARPITRQDTGLLGRNLALSQIASVLALSLYGRDLKWLDFAGGYGVLTRLVRDYGLDCRWYDPFTENLFSSGFEGSPRDQWDFMTAFEYMEHIPTPLETLENEVRPHTRAFFVSTKIIPSPVPPPGTWEYYSPEHGQHVSFYTMESLRRLAAALNWHLYSDGVFLHLFSEKRMRPFQFRLLTRLARSLFPIIRYALHSKTPSDSRLLARLKER